MKFPFFAWIVIISLYCISCSGGNLPEHVETGINEFTDPEETFHVSINGKAEGPPNAGVYEFFERNELNEIISETRIFVSISENKQDADLFAPGYEEKFLSDCRCAVTSRGVVLFEGQQARQYVVTLRNGEWISHQRHFIKGSRTYVLSVRGPMSSAEKIRETFETTIASFHFIPSHE